MGRTRKIEQIICRQGLSVPFEKPSIGHFNGPAPHPELAALARLLGRQVAKEEIGVKEAQTGDKPGHSHDNGGPSDV